jgi:hypothetical protein
MNDLVGVLIFAVFAVVVTVVRKIQENQEKKRRESMPKTRREDLPASTRRRIYGETVEEEPVPDPGRRSFAPATEELEDSDADEEPPASSWETVAKRVLRELMEEPAPVPVPPPPKPRPKPVLAPTPAPQVSKAPPVETPKRPASKPKALPAAVRYKPFRGREALQQGIIMREVLGPPKALEDYWYESR